MPIDKILLFLRLTMPPILLKEPSNRSRSMSVQRTAAKFAAWGCTALFFAPGTWAADVNKVVETCASCHGNNGVSTEADVPTIAGYSAEYFSGAMSAYKKKERPCHETEIRSGEKKGTKSDMCRNVKDLSDADIDQLAKFYAGKKFVRSPQNFDPVLAKKGKEIHDVNCDKCHLEGGSVASDDAGILAGQRMQYLKAEFEDFKSGKRIPPKKMKLKIDKLEKDDIDALINFYDSFK